MNKKYLRGQGILGAAIIGFASLSMSGCSEKTSEEHILAARQFVEAKDTKSAIVEYKNAIQKDPKDASARFELGRIYVEQKNYAAAEKELNRALDLGYEASEVLPLLTRSYQETGSEVALSEVNHKTDGLTPVKRAEVSFYKLEALLRLEKIAEARRLIDDVRTIDTVSVYKGLSLALGKTLDEKYEEALEDIDALQQQAPLNKDVLNQQARLNMYLRNLDAAIEAYQKYIDVEPQDKETKFILTAILMDSRRYDDAEPLVDELLALSANHPLLNQFKGVIEVRKDNYAAALEHLETAIQNGRTDPLARLIAGFSAYQLKDYEASTRHLSMIASDLPPSHAALRMLADSLLQLGNNQEATEILSRVDGEADNDALLFSKAGYQLLQSGNVVDAKAMIEKSVPIATTAEDLTRIGVLQLSINDADGLVNLEAAVEQSPELAAGQQTLANAYIATKQYDKALEVANDWHKNEPDNVAPLHTIIQVHLARNELDEAQSVIEQAEALDSQSIKTKIQRVSLAMIKKQPGAALAATKEALKIDSTNQAALALYYIVQKEGGKTTEALDYIREVVKRNPKDDTPKIVLARILLNEKAYAEGLTVINKVSPENDNPFAYWDTKGRLLVANEKVIEARTHYQEWLKVQPNNKIATLGLAMLLDVQSKFADGVELTSSFLEKRPDRQIQIVKAYFHAMQKQIREAELILNTLNDEENALPYVKGIRARLQLFRDDYEAALPNALVAYEAMPNTRNLLLLMAAYELSGQPDEAFEVVTGFLDKNPNNVQALLLYAERLISRDQKKAIAVYRDVVKGQPENAIALNNLAYLEHQEGMLDDAEEHVRQALEIVPNAPEVVDTLAQILIDQGELEEAEEAYDSVMKETIRNDDIYLNYIELLLKLDMKTLAERRLNERVFESKASKERLQQLKTTYDI